MGAVTYSLRIPAAGGASYRDSQHGAAERGSIVNDEKRVYRFGSDEQGRDVTEGSASMNYVLGGKGANLAEMCRLGLPVPGFLVSISAPMAMI